MTACDCGECEACYRGKVARLTAERDALQARLGEAERALERVGRTYTSERPGHGIKCRMCCADVAACNERPICPGGQARRALAAIRGATPSSSSKRGGG